ncbi:hypothetical protein AB4Z50_14935 [Paenibacillus sp. 2TAB26]|uniref:hypothetical protein n=1 Tax=Paenibacillus sp. 2TAB26 TaxID=3233005 RepID=UPI003F977B41
MIIVDHEVEPIFEEENMRRLVMKDKYLKFVVDDMVRKGLEEADALLIVFTSNVIGDSVLTTQYKNSFSNGSLEYNQYEAEENQEFDFESCSGCMKSFGNPSEEIDFVADRLSPDGVNKTGVMYFCVSCSKSASKKYRDGRYFERD